MSRPPFLGAAAMMLDGKRSRGRPRKKPCAGRPRDSGKDDERGLRIAIGTMIINAGMSRTAASEHAALLVHKREIHPGAFAAIRTVSKCSTTTVESDLEGVADLVVFGTQKRNARKLCSEAEIDADDSKSLRMQWREVANDPELRAAVQDSVDRLARGEEKE